MNGIQLFSSPQFGQIRTAGTPENPLFCATDIARALGYANPAKAIIDHCKGVTVLETPTAGGPQSVKYVTEPDMYRLIFKSNAPFAEEFITWVSSVVLPSIRRHGGFLTKDALSQIIANPETAIEMLSGLAAELRDERQKVQILEGERQLLQEKVEVMTDKAQYTDDVLQSTECYTFEQMSKELNFPSVYKFISRLKADGVVYKRSDTYMLYGRFCGHGLTATRTHRFFHRDGTPGTSTSTVWTQKGRMWLNARYGAGAS